MDSLIAKRFDDQYVGVADIKAAGAKWDANGAVYQFPDGSYGRFTDIRNGAQEKTRAGDPVLRFIAGNEVLNPEDRI